MTDNESLNERFEMERAMSEKGGEGKFARVMKFMDGFGVIIDAGGSLYRSSGSFSSQENAQSSVDALNLAHEADVAKRVKDALLKHIGLIEFTQPPCYICGFNGPGYYQPEKHFCAKAYHEKSAQGATHG